jgi:hypothetical protein
MADVCIYCNRPRREHSSEGQCSPWAYADNILDNLADFGEQGTRWDTCLRCGNVRLVGSLDELCARCHRATAAAAAEPSE